VIRQAMLVPIVLLAVSLLPGRAQNHDGAAHLAPTPPMGWNSWDAYGASIRESEFKANARWMAAHLKQWGWRYVVIDGGWYYQIPKGGGRPPWKSTLDGYGRHLPAPNRFPSAAAGAGFKPLADYVHSLGLKFGLHMMRGIPREAVADNLPIAGSPYHASDAAETSDTCSWDPENYGVKSNAAGQAYYDSVMKLFASWGLDFLKVDCTSSRPYKATEIHMISRAIRKTGRPIVLSLSPGPTSLAVANDVRKYAQMWRISNDFWDNWVAHGNEAWSQTLYGQFATAVGWAPFIQPGHWMDADMLPIGYLGPRPGLGKARWTRFTHDEQRTLITLWSIIRSPLIIGGNLTRNDSWTTSLLTNREVIAVDQHSTGNRPLITSNDTTIWAAEPEDGNGHYLAVFNRSDSLLKIDLRWNEVGLVTGEAYNERDLWEHKDVGAATSLKLTLRPHACVLYRMSE
jgi:alpha-galactosidase